MLLLEPRRRRSPIPFPFKKGDMDRLKRTGEGESTTERKECLVSKRAEVSWTVGRVRNRQRNNWQRWGGNNRHNRKKRRAILSRISPFATVATHSRLSWHDTSVNQTALFTIILNDLWPTAGWKVNRKINFKSDLRAMVSVALRERATPCELRARHQ